jgi:divalent anion:Na+ symporter, DASS family
MKRIVNLYGKNQKLLLLGFGLLLGFFIYCSPTPDGLTVKSWHLFAIFIATIFCIVTNPLPMGAISLISITFCVITKTISLQDCLLGFSNDIVWLVVFAFFIAQGFIRTGLGSRFAYYFISKLGHTTLGLSYGLVLADFTLSPLIPSVTARGGGIIFPIAQSLCKSFNDESHKGVSTRTSGFIMQVCFQANVITSSLFLTAMAANPLIVKLAQDVGVEITWATWALAALVPGIINLAVMPLALYVIYAPTIKHSDSAPKVAREHLKEMGSMKWREWSMLFTFVLLIILWVFGGNFGISSTLTALIGASILLLTSTITFDDILTDKPAWHTFIWFATLVMLSGFLSKFGLMSWFGQNMKELLPEGNHTVSIVIVMLIYYYIHYLFASVTTHITVLYPTFVLVLITLGLSPLIATLSLGFLSIISGGITHFSLSSAPIYFGVNYMSTKTWWYIGAVISFLNLMIWGIFGSIWWKILGWW